VWQAILKQLIDYKTVPLMNGIKKYGFVIGLVFMAMLSNAQSIAGKLSFLAHQEIAL
jgi:hypothetical protein